MTADYNATIYLTPVAGDPDGIADSLLDALAPYHPSAGQEPWGDDVWHATITLPAENLPQAITTALAITSPLGAVRGIDVLPTTDFDARHRIDLEAELDGVELLSVAQAAQRLGITPQGVRHRIAAGSLPARRVGRAWSVPATALTTTADEDAASAAPRS